MFDFFSFRIERIGFHTETEYSDIFFVQVAENRRQAGESSRKHNQQSLGETVQRSGVPDFFCAKLFF